MKNLISIQQNNQKISATIETERLIIESYKDRDFQNCIQLYGDREITRYFDHGKPRTYIEVQQLIEERGKKYFENGEPFGLFSLFLKEDGRFIGQADLFPTDEPGVLEIGCILLKQFQRMKYGTEAVKALIIDYIDDLIHRNIKDRGMSLYKILGTVHPDNLPSNMLVRKCGMQVNKFQERFGNPRIWYYYEIAPKEELQSLTRQ